MRKGFCEACGPPRKAEFTVSRISESGKRAERSLCARCAQNAERIIFGDTRFPLTDLYSALVTQSPAFDARGDRTKVCPECGNSEQEVVEAAEVGCTTCYAVFRDEIAEVIRKIHSPESQK